MSWRCYVSNFIEIGLQEPCQEDPCPPSLCWILWWYMVSGTSFEFGNESGVIRAFQKGITLGGRTSRSVWKVFGGVVGGLLEYSVYLSPLREIRKRKKYWERFREKERAWGEMEREERGEGERGERGEGERGEREIVEERDCDKWTRTYLHSNYCINKEEHGDE